MPAYNITPRKVPHVQTKYRRVKTLIPAPDDLPILQALRKHEPDSLSGQPPVVWDRAEGFQVYDAHGNVWIDFSSGVLVANAGHAAPEIRKALEEQVRQGLLHSYCFPHAARARLVERLVALAPKPLEKCFLLTTGSEAVECVLKVSRAFGRRIGGPRKIGWVSFQNAFHGRTLGAQTVGGIPALKEWIGTCDADAWQVPFPDGFRTPDTRFELFEESLAKAGVSPDRVALVILESYQGGGASFAPAEYVQRLRKWCDRHRVLLAFDEVQASFGRTGKRFAFEHYGVVPDLVCLGKGITSSLPLAAVLGRADAMNQFPAGSMTSTHTGNPLCVAAALASIGILVRDDLPARASATGEVLHQELRRIRARHPDRLAAVHGKGLVAGVHVVKPGGTEPDGAFAFRVNERCVEKGLLMFAPVGQGGATIKIAPPLPIPVEALVEGCQVLEEAIAEVEREISDSAPALAGERGAT